MTSSEGSPPRSPPEPPGAPARSSASPGARAELARLEAEARYHRERLALYRARIYASKPTSGERVRELERAAAYADERLRLARHG